MIRKAGSGFPSGQPDRLPEIMLEPIKLQGTSA